MLEKGYEDVTDYRCPICPWNLHVDKKAWGFDHKQVLIYIQSKVEEHANTHGTHSQDITHILNDKEQYRLDEMKKELPHYFEDLDKF